MIGTPLLWLGEAATAHAHFEQTIARFDPRQHRGLALHYGLDPGSASRAFTAFMLWTSGYADQALRQSQEALMLAQELAHPFRQAYVLFLVALFHWLRRDAQSTCTYAEACISLATKHGFPFWIIAATWPRGAALARQGQLDEGIAQGKRI
jgi:adenylate cyclase